jgi:galactose mutarotase-like enzyme
MEKQYNELLISSGGVDAKIAPERGAIVTSFAVNQRELLYLDRTTFVDPAKNVRGGIPLLFPNAGKLNGTIYELPSHGFARRMPWRIIEKTANAVTLGLTSDAATNIVYPFDFELNLKVSVSGNQLTHCLTVRNNGNHPMATAYGLHPYFQIAQQQKQLIKTNIPGFSPTPETWEGEIDTPYINPGTINLNFPQTQITVTTDPSDFKLARIWHIAGKDFICVEPWTRDDYALDDITQTLFIPPHESKIFKMIIKAYLIS